MKTVAGRSAEGKLPDFRPPSPLLLESVEIRRLRLKLVEPFETSFGRVDSRLIVLVRLESEGIEGWGEIVAGEEPLYSYETTGTVSVVVRDHLAPAILGRRIGSLGELAGRLGRFRGHPMARAGLELAFADLVAKARGETLASVLGGVRDRVAAGVSLGIQEEVGGLLDRIEKYVGLGYQRIKLKIKPGWDVAVLDRVRERFAELPLSVDANAAYQLADLPHLRRLDAYGLLMIEQPLAHDDLVDHARLQRELATDICLDESITGAAAARQALELGSCRIINLKVGRVGGYSQALAIHDICLRESVPLWCGGMLESGIGRAHNLALASLPGFTLPGDISASRRYFDRDLIVPEVEVSPEGTVSIPPGPGIGFAVDRGFVEARTEHVERFTARRDGVAVS